VVVAVRRRAVVWWAVASAAVAVGLAIAPWTAVTRPLLWLPIVSWFRLPMLVLFIFQGAVAVLAAIGLDAIAAPDAQAKAGDRPRRIAAAVLGASGLAILAIDATHGVVAGADVGRVASMFGTAAFVVRCRRRTTGALVLALFTLAEGVMMPIHLAKFS